MSKIKFVNWDEYKHEGNPLYDPDEDRFFGDRKELLDYYMEEKKVAPTAVYGCYKQGFQIDFDEALTCAEEQGCHHEDVLDCAEGLDYLEEAVRYFNKINEDNGTWISDEDLIVKIF